ncbi:MaoC family dehydratase [Tardiphaga alba]|uniref:MaoC family dehydratase n=1 Tax=Tardiphaga alba TaxID=340268 RepID=A0ABX8AFP4_9BRAD|nr:MaoC family dehydratase [Tardiphaga alba]QUS41223.1 MaoC family dehydratase [Tardiphaga alba]
MPFLEDIKVGHRRELGTFTFTADNIKTFAREFDPQPFHLDEEAGRNSLFGGLAASGWHVASVCMKLIVAEGVRARAEAEARGEEIATGGPSPGFRDLRWIKPVLAGDTLTYTSEIESVRATASRPGWGIVHSRNVAVNQRGEEVYSFLGSVFMPQRGERR